MDLTKYKNVPREYLKGDSRTCQIIDNGHGGMKDYKRYDSPLAYLTPEIYGKKANHYTHIFFEGTWNRIVALEIAKVLYDMKLNYKIIVPEEEDVYLSERCRRANEFASQHLNLKTFFHSIHGNAFGLESVKGIEVYTSIGTTKSDEIATIFYEKYNGYIGWNMRSDWSDGDADKEAKFTVLTQTNMPAILSELGFYTNPDECLEMLQTKNIKLIAETIGKAHKELEDNKIL
jgi:N-acetylmuramoyl-L-alanine amidase